MLQGVSLPKKQRTPLEIEVLLLTELKHDPKTKQQLRLSVFTNPHTFDNAFAKCLEESFILPDKENTFVITEKGRIRLATLNILLTRPQSEIALETPQ
jgi:predicted transcriptional regulator